MNNHVFWDRFVMVTTAIGLTIFGVMVVITLLS